MDNKEGLKILFVCEYYLPHIGGAEFVFVNLAERLVKDGHECYVVTSRLPKTKEYEEINGVKVQRVRVPQKGTRYWFTFLSIPKIIKRARQVDLIHTTTFNAAFPAWLVSKLLGKKCVITIHEIWRDMWIDSSGMNWLGARLHRFLEKMLVRLPFHKAICVSKYTADCLESLGVREEKIRTIYNGVDNNIFSLTVGQDRAREELSLPESEFIYLYYGRPGVSKGVEYLVEAVPLISKRIPNSISLLILVNDPRDRYENIKKLVRNLNIEDKVMLLDPVPRNELPNYVAAADCVVVPSLSEGFGFTAAEACAMGKPVVVSNVASLPEVVSGRYVLVEPGNPEAIADGVEKVYKGEVEDSEKKTFSWEQCVEQYLQVYEEMQR